MPVSSSQKPCSTGEREWLTGHPMMPARHVVPVIFIRQECDTSFSTSTQTPLLRGKRAAFPQEAEKLHKRKPENRKIIALDLRKELDSSRLEPVSADRPENGCSLESEVGVQECVAELPHCQFRRSLLLPYQGVFPNHTSRGNELVGTAAQCLKLAACIGQTCRLVEPRVPAHEDLIGADDQPLGIIRRDLPSLGLGQSERAIGC